jgi:hypothetical protein
MQLALIARPDAVSLAAHHEVVDGCLYTDFQCLWSSEFRLP